MPASPWHDLYPFAPHELLLAGHRYHYVNEGSGPPLLMVHGNPTWSFYWRNLLRELRGEHRVVAPDHMGCGLSDKPQDYPYRLAQHIDNLCQLVNDLDLRRITLLAHDWGGAIGLGSALALPDRFDRLVLFNTAAFRSDWMPLRIRLCRTPWLGSLAVRGLNAFCRAALRMATCRPERFTAPVRAGYLAPYDTWAHRVAIDRFVNDIPMSPRHPSYATLVQIEEGLPRLAQLPTMFVWGMRDWCFTPEILERFLQFFPAAEVHRLADAGHFVVEDAHEQIIPLVRRFVAQADGREATRDAR